MKIILTHGGEPMKDYRRLLKDPSESNYDWRMARRHSKAAIRRAKWRVMREASASAADWLRLRFGIKRGEP